MSEEEVKIPKNMCYDFTQKKFSEKDSNFLRYINDSSHDLNEFREFVIYHRDSFLGIIEHFKYLIKIAHSEDDGIASMKERIKELTQTIEMLNDVLYDIKTDSLNGKKELQPE